MEIRKNLGSSVLQVLNLKPGIHVPFVYIVVLLKWQINYTPTEDLTTQVQGLCYCSEEVHIDWHYHLHFINQRTAGSSR